MRLDQNDGLKKLEVILSLEYMKYDKKVCKLKLKRELALIALMLLYGIHAIFLLTSILIANAYIIDFVGFGLSLDQFRLLLISFTFISFSLILYLYSMILVYNTNEQVDIQIEYLRTINNQLLRVNYK